MEGTLKEIDSEHPAYLGQAVYTRRFLKVYDAFAYGINCRFIWRCPKSRLVRMYDENVSLRHLDVGVATGALLDACRFPGSAPQITLMDLNPQSLAAAAGRLARYAPRTRQGNVLEPWDLPERYDSIAMTNLLHCVPGTLREKAVAFEHAKSALAPGGVLFGATILGEGVEHTKTCRRALRYGNRKGLFCNAKDSLADLRAVLGATFETSDVEVQGSMALFSAREGG
jgi:SAM-dependent methyltransferase